MLDKSYDAQGRTTNGPKYVDRKHVAGGSCAFDTRLVTERRILGYACSCCPTVDGAPDLARWTDPPPTRRAVVLDSFGGTGTTAVVADALGRFGVSMDMSRDYSLIARWRILESGEQAKVRSRTEGERQDSLFD